MKKHSLTIKLLSVLVICGLLFAAAPVDQVQATSLCVNTDGSGGCYTTIQAAINAAAVGDTINVAAGKYVENVNINKTISLIGADATTTSIVGTTGMKTPLTFAANNITVNGFTLTHEYTEVELTTWNDSVINNSGVTFNQGFSGNILENCVVTLNRNGVYLNTTQNNIIRNNTITNNRTGINLTNNVNGTQITGNTISDNWTLGLVYYYQSGAATDFSTWTVTGNTFDGNWYSEILVKNAGASTGALNLSSNTFTDSPVTYTNSADASLNEPGFSAQKPASLGGSATKPANELPTLRIYNSATASLSYPQKTLMVGASQGYTTIQAAIDAAANLDTIYIAAGTYVENPVLDSSTKQLNFIGATDGEGNPTTIIQGLLSINLPGNDDGWRIENLYFKFVPNAKNANLNLWNVHGVTIDNCVFDGEGIFDGGGVGLSMPSGSSNGNSNVTIENSTFTNGLIGGIQGYANYLTVRNSTFTNISSGINHQGGGGNLVVEDSTFNVVAKSTGKNIYGIRFGSSSINNMSVVGSSFVVDSGGFTPDSGVYFASVIVRAVASGTLQVENSSLISNVVNLSTTSLDASPNWWGSMAGPATGQISGTVTFSPWCANEACTAFLPNEAGEYELPGDVSGADIQNVLDNAPTGSTIIIPAGTHSFSGGFQVNNPHLTILLKDGAIIQNASPCFIVAADYTRITTESIGGAKCVPTDGSNGIDVNAGITDIRIEGLEIDGTGQTTADGIHFAGAVADVLIDDNFIHNLSANGINFTSAPANVEIKGNLIKNNGALGIAAPIDLDVTYNSWGTVAGATADSDVSAVIINNDPFTHVELSLVSSGTPWADHVLPGYSITYTVTADFENALGADFDLFYPAAWASNMTAAPVSGCFGPVPTKTSVLDTSVDGVISYAGYSNIVVDQTNVPLYTITFTAPSTGGLFPINLDETSDAFVMNPGFGASNNIYASDLFDAQLDVITDFPTLTATGLDATFAATYPQEFSLTLTNPVAGVTYDTPQLQFTLPTGTTLEYWNGASWTTVSGTLDLAALANDGVPQTLQFRAAFPASGSQPVSISLIDTDFPLATLATLSTTVTVNPNYTVTGTFSMQGRSVRSGIPVTLTMASALYGPFPGSTIDVISNNLSIANVAAASYTVTTSQPRYLNVTADLAQTIAVSGPTTMSALELKGGNATDADLSLNTIDVDDASAIGADWGGSITDNGDVNFSGKVDIFDLAIVGGNFDLTSALAYASWSPLP